MKLLVRVIYHLWDRIQTKILVFSTLHGTPPSPKQIFSAAPGFQHSRPLAFLPVDLSLPGPCSASYFLRFPGALTSFHSKVKFYISSFAVMRWSSAIHLVSSLVSKPTVPHKVFSSFHVLFF